MPYLHETTPPRGTAIEIVPGYWRLVAENPGPMTYHGTNTYLFEHEGGVCVIDPGPQDAGHLAALLAAISDRPVGHILLTHSHSDHLGNVAALVGATGAPVAAFHASADSDFIPGIPLRHGDEICGLEVVHTPGHSADHLCYADGRGHLFSGDHVMAWCSTVVGPPPRGDMEAYLASLRLLLGRDDRVYLPGHGPVLPDPRPHVADLLEHRLRREAEIERVLAEGMGDPSQIAERLYAKADPVLRRAAERNVMAHLSKLEAEGRAVETRDGWRLAPA